MAEKNSYQLVIVESPAKAKTIGQFLGNDYVVKSSYGHIRDLPKDDGVDLEHGYAPRYVIPDDKKQVVGELMKLSKGATSVWLASDEDREGEAISWHLAEVLDLDVATTKRIVFHEITKGAIQKAIKTPRTINMNLVDAQQARRVLDRLVGFELSPVLWRKVRPNLSAGRVQSVAVRILVDREREIIAFRPKANFSASAIFGLQGKDGKSYELHAELNHRLDDEESAEAFLRLCAQGQYAVSRVEVKDMERSPAPPFTTSTLQQEASRKLGMSVSQTMRTAQTLYEAGLITYMRTDSVNLSDLAMEAAANQIVGEYGAEYYHKNQYKTQSRGAQEAHEAIRPTDVSKKSVDGTPQEKRLYDLIWKRMVASQMSKAKIERTTIIIDAPDGVSYFSASADIVKFDGFMRLYMESDDSDEAEEEQVKLPGVGVGDKLTLLGVDSREKWTQRPSRYNEAALVKKLEELGIGRPSTYASTISTIQSHGYVVRETREGATREFRSLSLRNGNISKTIGSENYGTERNKLFPTDVAMVTTDFLMDNFQNVMSYDFTANMETQLDEVAEGQLGWQAVVDDFYRPFHVRVDDTLKNAPKSKGERMLGVDPASGKNVYARIGRFGPMAQIGESDDEAEKPRFASLHRNQHIETITLEEALKLFKLPRDLGEFEGKKVVVGSGQFGPYVRHDDKYVSLKKGDDPYTIDLAEAIELILAKRQADQEKTIKVFGEDATIRVLKGRYGPYIAYGRKNVKIPSGQEPSELTYEECRRLCDEYDANPPQRRGGQRGRTSAQTTAGPSAAKTTRAAGSKNKTADKAVTTSKTATKADSAKINVSETEAKSQQEGEKSRRKKQ